MTMIGIALMLFSLVLLIVSIYYITTTTRHKERMALIDKGMDPSDMKDERYFLDAMKFGMALIGAGIGYFIGIFLDNSGYFGRGIEMPLYFAPIFVCCGIGLIIFYKSYGNRYKN